MQPKKLENIIRWGEGLSLAATIGEFLSHEFVVGFAGVAGMAIFATLGLKYETRKMHSSTYDKQEKSRRDNNYNPPQRGL